MKKVIVVMGLVAALSIVMACKEKRCECITIRVDQQPARGLEPLGTHKSCEELNAIWESSDSLHDMLKKECTEYME